ncbi:MAG: hypothetical protein ACK2UO_01510 [Caldilineaceae bacterium]
MNMRSVSLGLPVAMLLLLIIAMRASAVGGMQQAFARHLAGGQTPAEVLSGKTAAQMQRAGGAPSASGLIVTATVGIVPDVCAQSTQIRVAPQTQVYYCYQVTNISGDVIYTHTVVDSRAGVIWDRQSRRLEPGETLTTVDAGLTLDERAEVSSQTHITWTASAITPTLVSSTSTSASVLVMGAGVSVTKTASVAGAGCPAITHTVVPDGGSVEFCFRVQNTGDIPLNRYVISDPIMGLAASFAYTLSPSESLTITNEGLQELGIDGALVRTEVTRSLVNTAYFTATSASDALATGALTVTDVASATVDIARAGIRFTTTVGTDEAICSGDTQLTVASPDSDLYFCAKLRNEGNFDVTHHILSQPARGLYSEFDYPLAPGQVLSITNSFLDALGLDRTLGPASVYDGVNLALSNNFRYTGTTSLAVGVDEETRAFTVTASSSAGAAVAATPIPSSTPTFTPRSATARPTNTPAAATPTWTPASPLATPTAFAAQQSPLDTPTPTRSYQISLLETPTPTGQAISPLQLTEAQAAAATQAALATVQAEGTLASLYATATAQAQSPLETPTPTPGQPTPTPSATEPPAAEAIIIAATATIPLPTQRPVQTPPPPPTPDALLFAAHTVDSIVMTVTWIWFLVGTLVFFIIAGVLVGLSFRQNEQQRFDLLDAGLVEEYEFLIPPPAPPMDDDEAARPE